MKLGIASVRRFVEEMLRSRENLASPPGIGRQLERAFNLAMGGAQGCGAGALPVRDDSHLHNATQAVQERYAEHGDYASIWAELTPEEALVLELKHSPRSFRVVRCERRLSDVDAPGSGLKILRHLRDGAKRLTGWAEVEDREILTWSTKDIALELGLSEVRVRALIRSANEKIRRRLYAAAEDPR